jgi:hypothetical protein
MAAAQKANGPAEAATSPDHGSINPTKDQDMNVHHDSTAGGSAPADRNKLSDAVGDLESPLCDALNMARITSLLIEQVRLETVDGRRQILLQEARAESLVWAIYQTETLFKAAHAAWDEVNDLAFDLRRAS